MSEVLDYVRKQDPRFADVPDGELIQYIGKSAPEFLADPDFSKEFNAQFRFGLPEPEEEPASPTTSEMQAAADRPVPQIEEIGAVKDSGPSLQEQLAAVPPPLPIDVRKDQTFQAQREEEAQARADERGVFRIRQEKGLDEPPFHIPRATSATVPVKALYATHPNLGRILDNKLGREVSAGTYNAVVGLSEFFMSPVGVGAVASGQAAARLPAQVGAKMTQGVAFLFAASMGKEFPRQVEETVKSIKEASETGNVEKAVENTILTLVTPFFIKQAVKHGAAARARAERATERAKEVGATMTAEAVERSLETVREPVKPLETGAAEQTIKPATAVEKAVTAPVSEPKPEPKPEPPPKEKPLTAEEQKAEQTRLAEEVGEPKPKEAPDVIPERGAVPVPEEKKAGEVRGADEPPRPKPEGEKAVSKPEPKEAKRLTPEQEAKKKAFEESKEEVDETQAEVEREGKQIAAEQKLAKEREKAAEKAQEVVAEKPVTPAKAEAKVQAEVTDVAKTEGKRDAKEVKAELVKRIEEEIEKAEFEAIPLSKVTIEIPGDGTFTIVRSKENLQNLLKRAKRIETKPFEKKPQVSRAALGVSRRQQAKATDRPRSVEEERALESARLAEGDAFDKVMDLTFDGKRVPLSLAKEGNAEQILRSVKGYRLKGKQYVPPTKPKPAEKKPAKPKGEDVEPAAKPGAPLRPSATAKTPPALPVKAQSQIIRDIAKGLKVPISFRRLHKRKAGGFFNKTQNLIRTKHPNAMPEVAHEVGHKLDTRLKMSKDPAIAGELDRLGDPATPGSRSSWTKSKSRAYKLEEGVSEFTRHWLTDPVEAKRVAPNTFNSFERLLDANKDLGDTLRQAQHDIKTWRESPDRLESSVIVGSNPNKTLYTLDQLTRDFTDELNIMRVLVEDVNKASGRRLPPSQDPYLLARNLKGSFGAAQTFVQVGVVDFKTKAVTEGTSLEHALRPVAGRINDFRHWIVAKQALEMERQGKEHGLVHEDVVRWNDRFKNDKDFQDAWQKVATWQKALVQYLVDAGGLSQKTANAWFTMNQEYVPMHRIFELGAGEMPAEAGGGMRSSIKPAMPGSTKRRTGSFADIIDPLETMMKNAHAFVTAAEKAAINIAMADIAKLPDTGKWIHEVAAPKKHVSVGVENVRKQLEASGADLSGVSPDLMLEFFQQSRQAPLGENTIQVMRSGKPEYYRLRKDLFETYNSLNVDSASKWVKMLSANAQLLRAGVTIELGFMIANVMRDIVPIAVLSKYGGVPFEAAIRGTAAMLRNKNLVSEWAASGGSMAIESAWFDQARLQKMMRERITHDMTRADRVRQLVGSPLTVLRSLGAAFENVNRIGHYDIALRKLLKSGMPEGDARRLAAFESRDRQDFAKGGAATKDMRRAAPFWNAGWVGNVRIWESLKTDPVGTTLKGLAYITVPKMIEQAINWNDDDYWDLPQWRRMAFFNIPRGEDENGKTKFTMFPVPFTLGAIFATLPGLFLQWVKQNRPEVMKEFPKDMLRNVLPIPMPPAVMVILADFLSGKRGWDIWRQRNVVPRSAANLPPDLQFTEQTSLTARHVGRLFGYPPVKVDHIIGGLTGGAGRIATHQVLDRGIEAITGEKRTATRVHPAARFLSLPAGITSDAVTRFYEKFDKLKVEDERFNQTGVDTLSAQDVVDLEDMTKASRDMSWIRSIIRETSDPAEKQRLFLDIREIAEEFVGKSSAPSRE